VELAKDVFLKVVEESLTKKIHSYIQSSSPLAGSLKIIPPEFTSYFLYVRRLQCEAKPDIHTQSGFSGIYLFDGWEKSIFL